MKVFVAVGVNRLVSTDKEATRSLDLRPLRLGIGYSTDARTNTSHRPSWVRSRARQYTLGLKP